MTAGASAAGTANTVNVVFAIVRQVVVKDVRNGRNMQTAGGNVGCDQNVDIAAGKFIENAQAFFLRNVAG